MDYLHRFWIGFEHEFAPGGDGGDGGGIFLLDYMAGAALWIVP